MTDDELLNDAVEGLQNFKDPRLLQDYVSQINRQVRIQTEKKKSRRIKRRLEDQNWTIISILLIIVLCVLGYLVIHLSHKENKKVNNTTIEQKK